MANKKSLQESLNEKPSKKWTVEKLKNYIREKTNDINKRINEYRARKANAAADKKIAKLQKRAGAKGKQGRELTYGFEIRKGGKKVRKKKEELLKQARELKSFQQSDVWSDMARKERDTKFKKAYGTFKEQYDYKGDLTEDEYEEWVTALGTIGAEALGTFSYTGAIFDEWTDAKRTGKKVDLVKIVADAVEEARGKGYDRNALTNEILNRIKMLSKK